MASNLPHHRSCISQLLFPNHDLLSRTQLFSTSSLLYLGPFQGPHSTTGVSSCFLYYDVKEGFIKREDVVCALKMKDCSLIRQYLTKKFSVINSIITKASYFSCAHSKPGGGKFCFTFFLLFLCFSFQRDRWSFGRISKTLHIQFDLRLQQQGENIYSQTWTTPESNRRNKMEF